MDNELRKQLRTGNIAGYDHAFYRDYPMIVRSFDDNSKRTVLQRIDNQEKYDIHNSCLLPIPLTIKRLIKLQFFIFNEHYVKDGCHIKPMGEAFLVRIQDKTTTIKFVHELQNFYFETDGHELILPFIDDFSKRKVHKIK